jgi:antirestriction protein ArdC
MVNTRIEARHGVAALQEIETMAKIKKASKASVAEQALAMVTARIESGDLLSWDSGITEQGVPRNAMTGIPYRGFNVLLGYWCGGGETRFLTAKQAASLRDSDPASPGFCGYEKLADGSDRVYLKDSKGGKAGDPVLRSAFADYDRDEARGIGMVRWVVLDRNKGKKGGKADTFMIPRFFRVWPLSCFVGLRASALVKSEIVSALTDSTRCEAAEEIIAGYFGGAGKGPKLVRGDFSGASYAPREDVTRVPSYDLYSSRFRAYKTIFHEGAHSTGHADRLNRAPISDCSFEFGDHAYSREELIAELCAAILCGQCGILPSVADNSAAYMQHWLGVLKSDPSMLLQCAGAAQKAADYITGWTYEVPSEGASEAAA